ncbi:MAG: NAD(P)-binding domain-containing protein [Inquilinaceae bacterium]
MARILILGAGVMGSAIALPAADNGHDVTLAGTPLDRAIIAALRRGGPHPKLKLSLPDSIRACDAEDLTAARATEQDIVILGVSSPGMDWAVTTLARLIEKPTPIALVTKGIVPQAEGPPATYPHTLPAALRARGVPHGAVIGIGGPCIARELAERRPTRSVYVSSDDRAARWFVDLMQTGFYRLQTDEDTVGVEVCAALKNFYAIGVSAMIGRYESSGTHAKNPVAALFQQAVDEMAALAGWMGGKTATAFGLAGLGDLHVTVGGGRNSRLGVALGRGGTITQALTGPLKDETVEGVDTGRNLAPALALATAAGTFGPGSLPLARAILAAIETDTPFRFDFGTLGHTASREAVA